MTENKRTFHSYLAYRDADAALRFFEKAFGFEVTMEVPDDKGGVMHAEVRYGDAAFTVFSDEEGYDKPVRKGDTVGFGSYIAVESEETVRSLFTRAASAGATVIWEPAMTEWGNYRCRLTDPENNEWTFGTHRPGQPQSGW